jgi:hypothetical protein
MDFADLPYDTQECFINLRVFGWSREPRAKAAAVPTRPCNFNLKFTGLTHNFPVDPAVRLRIPIRLLKLTQSLGQPCECYLRHRRARRRGGGAITPPPAARSHKHVALLAAEQPLVLPRRGLETADWVFTASAKPARVTTKREEPVDPVAGFDDLYLEEDAAAGFSGKCAYTPSAVGEVADIEIYFELARKPFYYRSNFILPSSIFMVLSYVSFWLSPGAAPARVAIGIIPVLIMVSQRASVWSTLPPISYSTWLSNYLLGALCAPCPRDPGPSGAASKARGTSMRRTTSRCRTPLGPRIRL